MACSCQGGSPVTRPLLSIVPAQATAMTSKPRQWLLFAFQEPRPCSWG